ncbi:MAG: hypothetical protein LBF15_04740 [Candidatus Peribacteria bacterium]|jgi:hypothetical protein|nr:hypothetical protein [Candidatus Peribacteria bacterium]
MKKFLALLSISLLLNSCYIKTNTPNTEGLSNLDEIINSGAELSEEVLDEGLSQKDKIINKKLEEIKKKLELKGLITK